MASRSQRKLRDEFEREVVKDRPSVTLAGSGKKPGRISPGSLLGWLCCMKRPKIIEDGSPSAAANAASALKQQAGRGGIYSVNPTPRDETNSSPAPKLTPLSCSVSASTDSVCSQEEYITLDIASVGDNDAPGVERTEDLVDSGEENLKEKAKAKEFAVRDESGQLTEALAKQQPREAPGPVGGAGPVTRKDEIGAGDTKHAPGSVSGEPDRPRVEETSCPRDEKTEVLKSELGNKGRRALNTCLLKEEDDKFYSLSEGSKVRVIQVRPVGSLAGNGRSVWLKGFAPLAKPVNPVASSELNQTQKVPGNSEETSKSDPEIAKNDRETKVPQQKHINQKLGIVSARTLQLRNGARLGEAKGFGKERTEASSSQGKDQGTVGDLRSDPGGLEKVEVNESRRRINAAIIGKIKNESEASDNHLIGPQQTPITPAQEAEPPAEQQQHAQLGSASNPRQQVTAQATLPPAVWEALDLGQKQSQAMYEETVCNNLAMSNCLVEHRALREVKGDDDCSREHVSNTQQPSDIMACCEKMVDANERFHENIQKETIAGHNAWMVLRRKRGTVLMANQNSSEEANDQEAASETNGGEDAPTPATEDGMVWCRGRVVKFCWPHPKDDQFKGQSKKKRRTKKNAVHPISMTTTQTPATSEETRVSGLFPAPRISAKMTPPTFNQNSNQMGSDRVTTLPGSCDIDDVSPCPRPGDLVPVLNPLIWAYETLQDPAKPKRPRMKNLHRLVDASRHRTRVRKMKRTRLESDLAWLDEQFEFLNDY